MTFKGIDWEKEIENVVQMGKQGITMEAIADHYKVSRQRIKQVYDKFGIDASELGAHLTRKVSKEAKVSAYQSKWGNKEDTALYHAQRKKFHGKKANALRIGWEWNIQFGEIEWPSHCPVLGTELDYFAEFRKEESPSFDRLDPSKGYVAGNVVIMSWRANRIKNDGSADEHRLIADYLDKRKEVQ